MSGIAAKEISPLWRPYTFPPLDLARSTDWEQKLQRMAERGARLSIRGDMPRGLQARFEDHLGECPACVAFLDSYRRTIQLSKQSLVDPTEAAATMPDDLVRVILAWRGR